MPNLNDIAQIAEALEKGSVAVIADRCVHVRNRNASCRRCMDACPAGALSAGANELTLQNALCIGCGACCAACPTEALVSTAPLDSQLAAQAAEACARNGGKAVFACARIASKRLADPARFAEVPCIARVDESMVLSLVAHGAQDVTLVDGTCKTCKYGNCAGAMDEMEAHANALLSAHGSDVRVTRASSFPDELLVDSAEGLYGSTRRGFISDAAAAAKETTLTAARVTIRQELGYSDAAPSIGERLRVDAHGKMPLIDTPRHDVAINALDALGGPVADVIESRLFGSVSIDLDACNACGMCAVFCPTGALVRDEAESASAPLRYVEFSASSCVQCGLCVDVCWKEALALSSSVPADELYDFEPRTFPMKTSPSAKRSLFGSR